MKLYGWRISDRSPLQIVDRLFFFLSPDGIITHRNSKSQRLCSVECRGENRCFQDVKPASPQAPLCLILFSLELSVFEMAGSARSCCLLVIDTSSAAAAAAASPSFPQSFFGCRSGSSGILSSFSILFLFFMRRFPQGTPNKRFYQPAPVYIYDNNSRETGRRVQSSATFFMTYSRKFLSLFLFFFLSKSI